MAQSDSVKKHTRNLVLIDQQLHFHTVLTEDSKKIQNLDDFLTCVCESWDEKIKGLMRAMLFSERYNNSYYLSHIVIQFLMAQKGGLVLQYGFKVFKVFKYLRILIKMHVSHWSVNFICSKSRWHKWVSSRDWPWDIFMQKVYWKVIWALIAIE